jgi:hypothetical protein
MATHGQRRALRLLGQSPKAQIKVLLDSKLSFEREFESIAKKLPNLNSAFFKLANTASLFNTHGCDFVSKTWDQNIFHSNDFYL